VEPEYDVFLSYNTKDQQIVTQIADRLKPYGIRVWMDHWYIRPGMSFLKSIDEAIRNSKAIAVFIGANNLGPWQDGEVEDAILEQRRRKIPVIPVLLPGTTDEVFDQLPGYLGRTRCVDFRSGVESKEAMDNLRWAITGKKPETDGPNEIASTSQTASPELDPVDDAINNLVQLLKTQNITFFLGPGAAYGSDPMPVQASKIALDLLSELRIIEPPYEHLLPPVDVAGLYYAIKSSDKILESRVTGQTADSSRVFPLTHERLAALLKLLSQRPARRSGGRMPPLIVTTSIDLMMERALLRAGVSFTRVVQQRSVPQVIINHYHNIQLIGSETVQLPPEFADDEPMQARVDDFDGLDDIIATGGNRSLPINQGASADTTNALQGALSVRAATRPILYKFLGSQDILNSCILSTSHHFEFARLVLQQNCIPEQLKSIIHNSTILFLGLWFMDPGFRLTYHTLLRDALHPGNDWRYALQLPPQLFTGDVYRKMEAGLWDSIKAAGLGQMGITTLEEPCDGFLDKLYDKAQAHLQSGV
jgi:hypothetical protein